ncbi:amino acid adenylation domain-containing protein [Streptomyces sp. NPDC012421]|uniref:amino acid adenylation domain-containing protein n=1 Tax=Streptomyces sp. NPDC012421 TaxID=3364832 RepID=UPI0036EB4FAE
MSDTTPRETGGVRARERLSPIQRAYLVGGRDGLELSGPARYYLSCDLAPDRAAGIGDRLRRLVRDNTVLRLREAPDLSLTELAEDVARDVDARLRWVDDADFDAADDEVRRACTSDAFAFGDWPRFEVSVVRSAHRARLHLVYSLWLMDAASLGVFLTELVAAGDETADRTSTDAAPSTVPASTGPAPSAVPASTDPAPSAVPASGHRTPSAVPASPRPAPAGGVRPAPRRDRSARDERFWRARAAGLPDAAELPLRPAWRSAGPAVSHRVVTLAPATAARIDALASHHALTPSMVYLAAYGAVLGRLGGGSPHTVTVLHSRHTGPVVPSSLGNRGSTMPLEIPETTGQSFLDLARTVQSRYLGQAMHGSLSGAEIARLADPAADLRRLAHPFAFTALDVDSAREAALGLRRRWDDVQLRVPQVLIDHQVVRESDGTVRLGFDWRTDCFDDGFAEDFVARCEEFVHELAASGEHWTRRPARSPEPRAPRTPTKTTPPADTLHHRVLSRAADRPDAPAVHDERGTLSYAELTGQAHALAESLLDAGARPGDRVAVHLPRGRGQVVAMLGGLLAGCTYVPLDHATPDGRLDGIARRGAVRFAVTAGGPAEDARWAERGVRPLALPAHGSVAGTPRPAAAPHHPTAYVIFTSGSTGEPKGVVISHTAVLNTIDAVNAEFGVTEADRVLSVSSAGFDLSVYDVFGPLVRGGSVVMLSEESAKSPSRWAGLIERHGVTLWNSAPALASLLAEERAAVPSVRAFLLSGDWIPLTLPAALRRLAPEAEVCSLGGATEGSIWSVFHRVGEADADGRSIPYGRALPGQEILVLDAERRECPDWQIGEIHIAGAGVADGYANDPVKTAAAFDDDPVYGRLYRTGDRGRRHPGGVVEFLGRTDSQVKLNGHRVELGEIEHLIEKVPGVGRCAAAVRDGGRRRRLVACVTLDGDAPAGWRQDVLAALGNAVPSYMIPEALLALDELPLNGNGKLDRRRLEELPWDDSDTAEAPEAPGTTEAPAAERDVLSHEVSACWQEVLGEAPRGESFFAAGGSSYDAIRLLSVLRSRYGHDVPFGAFMTAPTVAGLAALCRRPRASGGSGIWTYQPRSSAAPRLRLVLFPPVGGGVSCYAGLVGELADDIDVHLVGLDAPLEEGTGGGLSGLARRCLAELAGRVPSDAVPLVFAGWSFGGALAHEAARVSEAPVARVVVIDTPVSPASRGGGTAAGGEETLLAGFLRDIRETGGVRLDAGELSRDPVLATRFAVHRQNMTLLRDWTPAALTVPLVEFRAGDGPAEGDPGAWGRYARREESLVLAGGHFAVLTGANTGRVRDAIEGVKSDDLA